MEVGSRQWGGGYYEVDFSLGSLDLETGEHSGTISYEVRRAERANASSRSHQDRQEEILRVTRDSAPRTKTEILKEAGGKKDATSKAFQGLVDDGKIIRRNEKHAEGDRKVKRDLWFVVEVDEATKKARSAAM